MFAQFDVADARDLGRDPVLMGDRAGDDVDLVDVGDRDHDAGVAHPRRFEGPGRRAVGFDDAHAELLLDPTAHLGVPLDHDDLVRLVTEPLGDVIADLAGADDDDAHGWASPQASGAGSWYSGQRAA